MRRRWNWSWVIGLAVVGLLCRGLMDCGRKVIEWLPVQTSVSPGDASGGVNVDLLEPVSASTACSPQQCVIDLPADVNGDGEVDLFDLVTVSTAYGPQQRVTDSSADVNGDGEVNLFDLVSVANSLSTAAEEVLPLPATPGPVVAPTETLLPTHTRAARPSETPTLPVAERIAVTAWVDKPQPGRNAHVTVHGQISERGVGVRGVPVKATWYFATVTQYDACVTNGAGVASCRRFISGAGSGYYVRVEVEFSCGGRTYLASTGFTPQW